MPVSTRVGRFAIVQGQPQEEGPRLRSFPRQRPDEDEDELYVLVEPTTAPGEDYCGQLVDAIGRIYRQEGLSLTGAVLRSLRAAHQQLRDWNQRTLREQQVTAGVACLAVRGRTAYLAQVGPGVAYHVGDGHVESVAASNGAVAPLGEPDHVEPTFSRYQLSPGDILLLASPRLLELIDEGALRSILLRGPDEALVELFRLTRDQQEFALVLLSCVVEPEEAAAPPPPPAEALSETALEPGPPDLDFGVAGGAQAAFGATPGAAAEAALAGALDPQPRVRLKGSDADIRYPSSTGLRANMPRVPPLAVLALLGLAVVGLLGWCALPEALQRSREERYETLVADARSNLTNAQQVEDASQRRDLLNEADEKLTEAERREPGDAELVSLRNEVDSALAELNAELVLPDPDLVVDLSASVTGPVSVESLALGGGGAYLLDREQQRVVAISLLAPSPDPFDLFSSGALVGTDVVGAPQQAVWAEELGALLILDDARRLIAVTPGQAPRLLPARDSQSWGSADAIAHAGGALYVLDREGDQVWRYLPGGSGFDSERERLLTSVDLDKETALTIGDALYLLTSDGQIRRVRGGEELPFLQAGIDRPLASPASPVYLPQSRRLFVADTGNERIVVFSPEGTFLQQLSSPAFTDLRAIAVDEANGLLYVLSGTTVFRATLPASP
ncbi:MAG: hypothetical protein WEE64_05480 [Dehalococcoidia bacterium]